MHADNILALLRATRCECCGRPAVPGVTMCISCAAMTGDVIVQGAAGDAP